MPRALVQQRIPVDLSVVEFDLDNGEELFLTYTWEHEHGPGITRDGIGPPKMVIAAEKETTNGLAMRLGCWMTRESFLADEIAATAQELEHLEKQRMTADVSFVRSVLAELQRDGRRSGEKLKAHDRMFLERCPGYDIVAQQGCGDLTMNSWNVAYVNDRMAKHRPALLYIDDEKLEHRRYSCLVKWKPSEAGVRRMTIEDARFFGRDAHTVEILYDQDWMDCSNDIELAVSNQQVIRDGLVVPAVTICHQFGDLRHLLQLPNLNPDRQLHPLELPRERGSFRPRQFWNEDRSNDIWLGEAQLIAGDTENLLRMALSGPILLELPCQEEMLAGALTLAGYSKVFSDMQPLHAGDWRFIRRGKGKRYLEIYFRRNTYGWSMLGLSSDNRKLLWLGCTGTPGENGYKLEDAAEILRDAGAWNALLVDEGYDVMQSVKWEEKFVEMVPLKRRRLRATFIVARSTSKPSEG
jgi:hypothetical protein